MGLLLNQRCSVPLSVLVEGTCCLADISLSLCSRPFLSVAVGPECYSLKSQCMLITRTFPSFFSVLPPSLLFFFCSHFLCHFPFPVSHSPLHAQLLFFPAVDFVSLFLSPSLAVTSQRSEDVIPTLHSSLFISCLYLYFCTAVYGSPSPHSDTPRPLHSSHAAVLFYKLTLEA